MIKILSSPNQFMAAYNQSAYTVSSNNTAQPNFNFIIDVNQTGGAANPIARLKYPVQPSSTQLTFDVGSVLKNYCSYDFFNATGALNSPNTNSRIKYYLDFRELYDISGVPTLSSVLISSPTTPSSSSFKFAGNAIFDFEDFSATAYYDLRVENYGFLNSKVTEPENITLTQNKILTFFDPNSVVKKVQLSTGPGYSYTFTPTANEFLYNINVGKFLIDTSGITPTGNSYNIRLLGVGDAVIAQYPFFYNLECSQYDTVRLHWLNKVGGFDSFNFIKNSRHNLEIERKQFKAPLPIGYLTSDRLKSNYNTTIVDNISINSDWINEQQSLLFEELVTSPVIYLERSYNDFVAVNITNSSYEIKKFLTDRRMFNVTFDLQYTYNRYRQTL